MMNKNLEKVCRFLVENKIADKDLIVGFDEGILMYKQWEWDLNSVYTEVEVNEYEAEYEELLIEDCDQYKLIIDWDGTIEVESPDNEAEEIDSDIKALLDFCNNEEFKALLEDLKFMQEHADLFNKIYINMPKMEVR